MFTYNVIVIGGGLAGLTSAIHLAKKGVQVLLIEKNEYPKHKVCGEYISNEVLNYLDFLDIDVWKVGAKKIDTFAFSSKRGKEIQVKLPLGGFGISRYALDHLLYQHAISLGVAIRKETVISVIFKNEEFCISTKSDQKFKATYVLGAYGKRSGLDAMLSRKFIQNKSPWLGVKAHYKAKFPENVVALHNFKGGYCGLSQVETGHVNACYLTHYDVFKEYTDLEAFQKVIIEKNTALRTFFDDAQMVFEKPLAISQVSFESKLPVENHIIMIGDSAGLIHPLCGNGMAMAIHSAKIASELLIYTLQNKESRDVLERLYTSRWNRAFTRRLHAGRLIQKVLLNDTLTNIGVSAAGKSPYLLKKIIETTHGESL